MHPLVAQAIQAEIGAGERSDLHRVAARLLARDGARPEEVAVHLAQAGGRGDAWAVATLRDAAGRALAQGATETAADWLRRALEEPAPAGQRGALLAELGRAEAALGRPQAVERLRDAVELAASEEEAARNCADLGRALALQGRADAAAEAFERGLEHLDDPGSELGRELRAAWWSAATLVAAMRAEAMRAPEPSLPAAGDPPTAGERELLAQLAMQRAFEGRERDEVVGARRARLGRRRAAQEWSGRRRHLDAGQRGAAGGRRGGARPRGLRGGARRRPAKRVADGLRQRLLLPRLAALRAGSRQRFGG